MSSSRRERYRLKKERFGLKVRHYIQRMKESLHLENMKTKSPGEMEPLRTQTEHAHVKVLPHPSNELYCCSTKFLFPGEAPGQDSNAVDCEQNNKSCKSSRRLPIPDSLQLFEQRCLQDERYMPPFLHFNPLRQNLLVDRITDSSSNTNSSSVISRNFLSTTTSTEERNVCFPMNGSWRNYYSCKNMLSSTREDSLADIDEIVKV